MIITFRVPSGFQSLVGEVKNSGSNFSMTSVLVLSAKGLLGMDAKLFLHS